MNIRRPAAVLAAFVLLLPMGCATTLEKNWGRSYEAALQNQTLNPGAEKDLIPVEGLDENASAVIMQRYYDSLKKGGVYTEKGGKGAGTPMNIQIGGTGGYLK